MVKKRYISRDEVRSITIELHFVFRCVSFGVLAQVLNCWTAATSPLSRFFGGEAVEGRAVQTHVAARYEDGVHGRDW